MEWSPGALSVTGRVASYWSERSQSPGGRSSAIVAESPLSTVADDQSSATTGWAAKLEASAGRCGGQASVRPGA